MEYIKIGEIFKHKGEWYQCLKGTSCKECDFSTNNVTCDIHGEITCTRKGRNDDTSVIFKKLEKVGEPYFNGQYGEVLQEYKYYIPPITPDLRIHIIKLGIVGIEIKQNKEDMEEKKIQHYDCFFDRKSPTSNLKPFDLKDAKAGEPVCTRDGRKARIICFDRKDNTPIVALIECVNGAEILQCYHNNGRCYHYETSDYDLMMLPEKKEGWVNVYRDGLLGARAYNTKKEALDNASPCDYIDTVKIEWDE